MIFRASSSCMQPQRHTHTQSANGTPLLYYNGTGSLECCFCFSNEWGCTHGSLSFAFSIYTPSSSSSSSIAPLSYCSLSFVCLILRAQEPGPPRGSKTHKRTPILPLLYTYIGILSSRPCIRFFCTVEGISSVKLNIS